MSAMNLGDSNLRYVNTSRPQLIHTPSKQSVTASDDYYSLTSEGSSNDDRTIHRYQTPPMHRIATESQDAIQSDAAIPNLSPAKQQEPQRDGQADPAFAGGAIKRKPVSSSASSEGTIVRRTTTEISPPTPGLDDTPYIQFAIDQLTRDEEVAGTRHQSLIDDPPHRFDPITSTQGLEPHDRAHGGILRPMRKRPESPPTDDVLLPTEPATETFRYPKLTFVPQSLRALSLGALILCLLLMLAGLLFCALWPIKHGGFLAYDGDGTSLYFVFQYLPQILASIIIVWLLVVQSAMCRIFPFVSLASGRNAHNSGVLSRAKLFPTNYLLPNLSFLRDGEPSMCAFSVTAWLALFTVPLQSCLFQTRYYPAENIWKWTTVRPIAWTLFALYLLLIIGLLAVLFRLAVKETGLKWDPVSLADIMVIFHRSNLLSDFERSEIERSVSGPSKDIRIGYWRTSLQERETFYCIGDENSPVHRYSLERGKMKAIEDTPPLDLESQRPSNEALRADIRNPDLRYRWTPWFLQDTFVVAWIVIAMVLMIAFLVASFVNRAVEDGFLPLLPAPTTSQGFSPADFLYSFLPPFLGMILFLLWQPLDVYYRALQPFADLSSPHGSSAEKSLLLDYTACLPIEVTFRAIMAGHYKVAWISFVGLASITLPILAGGVFTAQFRPATQDILISASMPGYEALIVFVVIYVLSLLIIWPTTRRYLPHDISTLSQLVSFFYQSPLLAEAAFEEPMSKVDLVTRLLGAPTGEKGSPRYAFGIYMGQDGREHLGIDRFERPNYGEMVVDLR